MYTNNYVEIKNFMEGIRLSVDMGLQHIIVYSESKEIVDFLTNKNNNPS